ncbi:MAG: SO_0444 family Cu/Zn efflux transporter [Planctomycetota bacterium]
MDLITRIAIAFWGTLAEMAPWLILGFVAAGVLSVFFSSAFIERHLGGKGLGSVVKAAVLGAPLPLCSCGVIPLGASLYRQGASRGATSSFLLSTPQTGVDSIAATYALMGPVFAVVRPVVALINGILGGLLIDVAAKADVAGSSAEINKTSSSCCSSKPSCCAEPQPAVSSCCGTQPERAETSCCSSKPKAESSCCSSSAKPTTPSPGAKLKQALRYGLFTLPADIAGALVVGLAVAALLTALVPEDALAPYLGGGVLAMFAAVIVGAPLYVCATASIPIGMGLLVAGASPGAVLAFLIAGPATNAATISVTWNLLGRRTGMLYLLSVITTAVCAGLLLDAVFSLDQLLIPAHALAAHEHGLSMFDHFAAIALFALLIPAIYTKFIKPRFEPAPSALQSPA